MTVRHQSCADWYAEMVRDLDSEHGPSADARCEQTDGIGQPRWPNNRCILEKGHRVDHMFRESTVVEDDDPGPGKTGLFK